MVQILVNNYLFSEPTKQVTGTNQRIPFLVCILKKWEGFLAGF